MLDLQKKCIVLELKSTSKDAVLRELAEAVHTQCPTIDLENLQQVLKQREEIGSTGVGNGVAIPHGKIKQLEQILLCFGRSKVGIGFDAIDNRPVQLFVMILSPEKMAEEYLKTLAEVSRLLKKSENRNRLLHATEKETVITLFREQ